MPQGMKTGLHRVYLSARRQIAYILEQGAIWLIAWESASKSWLGHFGAMSLSTLLNQRLVFLPLSAPDSEAASL